MTTELTHEQAVALRHVDDPVWGYVVESDDALMGLWTVGLVVCSGHLKRMLTDSGRAALAAYDARWVTILREDAYESAPPSKAKLWRRVARLVGELDACNGPDSEVKPLTCATHLQRAQHLAGYHALHGSKREARLACKLSFALAAWEAAQ